MRTIIRCFGYQIVDAKEEADTELAAMSRNGLIDAVVSDDMDMLPFGAKVMIKNFTVSNKKFMQEISLVRTLIGLDVTYEQFVDVCVLSGCDYCSETAGPVVRGSGPIKSYELIKKYGSIQGLEKNRVITDHHVLDTAYQAAKYFMNPVYSDSLAVIKPKQFNPIKFTHFLEKHGYNLIEINKLLLTITS